MEPNPKNILVRAPNWIGDQILAYPFFYFLRRKYPRARIGVSCAPWVESIQFRGLVNEVYPLAKPLGKTVIGKVAAIHETARRLKAKGPWDLGILLPNSLSSAWCFYRAGVVHRRGYVADARALLLTEKLALRSGETGNARHRSQQYLDLLLEQDPAAQSALRAQSFWGTRPTEEEQEDLGLTHTPGVLPRFEPEREWPDTVPIEPPSEPYWVLAPGSTAESRRWPLERAASLSRMIFAKTKMRGLILGGPSEVTAAAQLCEEEDAGLSDWTAQGNVASNWKILRNARFVVSNDSGLAHLASLCGAPVFIAWGAGNPKHTEPIGPGRVKMAFHPRRMLAL